MFCTWKRPLTIFCHVRITKKDQTPSVGEEFCTNPIVKKISFTGSTAVGKMLMKQSSDTVKRLSLGEFTVTYTLMDSLHEEDLSPRPRPRPTLSN